jgi:hypothetical protein
MAGVTKRPATEKMRRSSFAAVLSLAWRKRRKKVLLGERDEQDLCEDGQRYPGDRERHPDAAVVWGDAVCVWRTRGGADPDLFDGNGLSGDRCADIDVGRVSSAHDEVGVTWRLASGDDAAAAFVGAVGGIEGTIGLQFEPPRRTVGSERDDNALVEVIDRERSWLLSRRLTEETLGRAGKGMCGWLPAHVFDAGLPEVKTG